MTRLRKARTSRALPHEAAHAGKSGVLRKTTIGADCTRLGEKIQVSEEESVKTPPKIGVLSIKNDVYSIAASFVGREETARRPAHKSRIWFCVGRLRNAFGSFFI